MGQTDHLKIDAVVDHLTRYVEAHGATPGSVLGQELRRRFPDLTPETLGYRTLTALLSARAPLLSIVGGSGADLLWNTEIADDLPGVELSEQIIRELLVQSPPMPTPPEQIRIERVRFEGYRSLLDVSLSLSPLTLLVGANGSGKSNLLDGLFRTVRTARFTPEVLFQGKHAPARIHTRGHSGPIRCEIVGTDRYCLRWTFADRHELLAGTQGHLAPIRSLPGSATDRAFGPAQLLELDASEIAQPAYSAAQTPLRRSPRSSCPRRACFHRCDRSRSLCGHPRARAPGGPQGASAADAASTGRPDGHRDPLSRRTASRTQGQARDGGQRARSEDRWRVDSRRPALRGYTARHRPAHDSGLGAPPKARSAR